MNLFRKCNKKRVGKSSWRKVNKWCIIEFGEDKDISKDIKGWGRARKW